MTTANQQAELERPVVRVVYFAEFDFKTGKQRLCTWNQNIEWGGYTWMGLGALASISAVEESDSLESRPLNFTLNAADPSWVALAVGSVEEYRGREAKLYMCPLNEQFQLVDTPEICWRGVMDMVSTGVDGREGNIVVKCETSAYGLKRRPALRLNHAQQQHRHPGDDGFKYLEDLIGRPQLWLSKKFQTV